MKPVSRTRFIKLWQASATLAEVAKKAKCTPQVASTRAYRMRKAGIPLKHMGVEDIEALAELARKAADANSD